VLAPLGAGLSKFSESGDELSKLSDRTGASVEALSELRHAAGQSAVSTEQLQAGLVKMNKVVGEAAAGSQPAIDALAGLGLSIEDLAGMSPDQQFEILGEAIGQIQDPATRTAAAMGVFGKGAANLQPLFTQGAAGIRALREEARALGLQVSSKDAAAATKFGDTWANLQTVLGDVFFEIGGAIAEVVTIAIESVMPIIVGFSDWIAKNRELVVAILGVGVALVSIGTGLVTIGGIIAGAGAALGALVPLAGAVAAGIAAILSPVGLVVGAIAGLAVGAQVAFGVFDPLFAWISSGFAYVVEVVQTASQGIFDAIAVGRLDLAFGIMLQGALTVLTAGLQSILSIFGVSINGISQTMATVYKTFGRVVAWFNSVRVSITNWITGVIGWIMGIDTSLEQQDAANAAKQWASSWEDIDTSALGDSISNQLDPATHRAEMQRLVDEAARVRGEAEAERGSGAAAPKMPELDQPNLAGAAKSLEKSAQFASVGSFGAQFLARMTPGGKSLQEKSVGLQQKQLDVLNRIDGHLEDDGGLAFSV
jgi:hypothetical protein